MYKTIKDFIKKKYCLYKFSYMLLSLIKKLNVFRYMLYRYESRKRLNTSIFDIDMLSKEMILYSESVDIGNSFYGHKFVLKKALKKRYKYYHMEHGLYIGSYVPMFSLKINDFPIITFSQTRLNHIKKALQKNNCQRQKTIITIGPYINYANSILTEGDKKLIKEKYGKILLVFPSHSIEGVIYKYNIHDFINQIEKKARYFDSVFICMYWKDIQDNRYLEYEKKGYQIVTAGHRNDPNFLGRLKDIIDLSNMSMSNTVGTHIGYCIARNKPHYLFNQFQEVTGDKVENEFKERQNDDYIKTHNAEITEIVVAFSKLSYTITDEQKQIVEKYWGKNEMKEYTINKKSSHNV